MSFRNFTYFIFVQKMIELSLKSEVIPALPIRYGIIQ